MNNTNEGDRTMSPEMVAARREDEELFILDVRNEDDYDEWHIEGSYNIPIYDQLLDEDFSGLAASLGEIPDDKEIVVACVAGVTSARAAEFLRDRGYDAVSMADGMGGWGRVHVRYGVEAIDGVAQIIRPGTGCVSYLVHDEGKGVVIDPSIYVDKYLGIAADDDVDIIGVIDTHAHADHISGGRALAGELDVPYYLNPTDAAALEDYRPLADGQTLTVGDRTLSVMHTPGHTPGSVSFRWRNALLSGDTLFLRSVGRPDLEGSDETDVRSAAEELFETLTTLATLPDGTIVLPGHFRDETTRPVATTLGDLESTNDLFGRDDREAFVETILEGLSEEPANFNRIKAINWGKEPLTEEAEELELGPNNCAAT